VVTRTAVLLVGAILTADASTRPLIIGHRGASGHRPEHTLASYRLAAAMGADYVEPDLVSTKDGVLIARHENEIGATTDAGVKYPSRKTTKTIDGAQVSGWFSEDFTLAEIKTLRARERLPFRSHEYDGQFPIPTFDEVILAAQQLGRELGRPVGIYPETKHPTYFRGLGLPIEEKLIASLAAHGWNTRESPVFIQSFESGNLRELRKKTPVRLIQLLSGPPPIDAAVLKDIATFADGIGAEKRLVVPVLPDGTLQAPTDLVARAHALGLLVHIWTIRVDKEFLPAGYKGRPESEFEQFRDLGVDGIFTDFPDVAARAFGVRPPPANR
jgi:glycerophosphoryl diester phosphodiesterase